MEERRGVLTFNGKPVTLVGVELKTGQKAPEFRLVDTDLNEVRLSDSRGKVKLLSM
ncbi:MAG: hypothetical protein IBX68_09265, partial [Dehalococcoidia bacterium]|nr:hypothetical protein [Dehalococcoidia bacterium]